MAYQRTFITMAEDCPVEVAQIPPQKSPRTKAEIEYNMLAKAPGEFTQDRLNYDVYVAQCSEKDAAPERREDWLSKGRACLRASALTKRYGWGAHYDEDGHITLVAGGSAEYAMHVEDPDLKILKAMRSKRA